MEFRNKIIPFKTGGTVYMPNRFIINIKGKDFDLTKPGDATKAALVYRNITQNSMFPGIGGLAISPSLIQGVDK